MSSSRERAGRNHAPSLNPDDAAGPNYVNYLDVKLEKVSNVPLDWYKSEGDAPAYTQHPFRYEVSLTIPTASAAAAAAATAAAEQAQLEQEKKESPRDRTRSRGSVRPSSAHRAPVIPPSAVFTHGRILQHMPQYQHYIDFAVAQSVEGMDEVSPIRDIPETLELPDGDSAHDVSVSPATNTNNTQLHSPPAGAGQDASAAVPTIPPPVILWVSNERTDVPPPPPEEASPHSRKKKKLTSGAASTVSGVSGANGINGLIGEMIPPPALPEKGEPAPCICRIPLDAEQESYLDMLLNSGQPLTFAFRRVLKPGVPAEWEDLNAARFTATIPVSLAPFAEPGSLHLQAAVALEAPKPTKPDATSEHERAKKKVSARRAKSGIPATLFEDPDPLANHPYTTYQTTAVISLGLQRTLSRLASDRVRPNLTPAQLIPTRKLATERSRPPVDVSKEFTVAVEEIAGKILRDFREGYAPNGDLTAESAQSAKEAWRLRFLEFFQSSGQLAAYKSQLTPLVIRIVQDKFLRDPGASREEIGQLSNELYVYLLECMHATLHRLVDVEEVVNATTTATTTSKLTITTTAVPRDEGAVVGGLGEDPTMEETWRQRAIEAEASQEFLLAMKYHQARIASYDGGPRFPAIWTDAAEFYLRVGDHAKAEQCYREAIACDPLHLPALVGYGLWLMAYERLNEAAVFLHGAVDVDPQNMLAWGSIALLDDMFILSLKEGSPSYTVEVAKWQKEHRYATLKALQYCTVSGCTSEAGEEMEHDLSTPSDRDGRITPFSSPVNMGDGANFQDVEAVVAAAAEVPTTTQDAPIEISAKELGEVSHHSINEKSRTEGCVPTFVEPLVGEDLMSGEVGSGGGVRGPSAEDADVERREAEEAARLATKKEERLRLHVAAYCLQLHHRDLANICLSRCRPSQVEVERLYAQLFVQGRQHNEALAILNRLTGLEQSLKESYNDLPVPKQLQLDEMFILRADCEAALGQKEAAVQHYKAALCKGMSTLPPYLLEPSGRDQLTEREHLFLAVAYLQLGNLLMAEGKYKDALGVLTLGIQAWPSGLMWLGVGVSYFRIGDYDAAEECLNESNIRNPLNPRTWAYLALLCIRTRRAEIEEVIQHVMIQGLSDSALWGELGRELLLVSARPQLSEICLRRAIIIEEEAQAEASSHNRRHNNNNAKNAEPSQLACISKYHLSHALMDMQRWEEARQVMSEVAKHSANAVLKAKAEEELQQLHNEM